MTCKECQNMIQDYLKNRLKAKELEGFIEHVRSCPDCYEELETYFIIGLATRVLEEGADVSYDIKAMLLQELQEKKLMLKRKKRKKRILAVTIVLLLAADILLTLQFMDILQLPDLF